MTDLSPSNTFQDNLKILLSDFDDEEITRLIEENLETLLLIGEESNIQNREPLKAAVIDLIQAKIKAKESDEN